jgi:hypothetical protein
MHPEGSYQRANVRELRAPSNGGERERRRTEELPGEDQPSIGQLMAGLVADAEHVIRKELELAKVEIEDMGRKAGRSAVAVATGGVVAGAGGLLLLFMVVHLITSMANVQLWISYAIVGGAVAVIGGILLASGIARIRNMDKVPRETADALRKDAQWIREQNPLNKK